MQEDQFHLKSHALTTAMRLADLRAAHGAPMSTITEILVEADKVFAWCHGNVPPVQPSVGGAQ